MKKHFLLKSILLLCALVVGSGSLWAATYTGTFTKVASAKDFVTGYYVVVASESASSNANYALGNAVNSDKRMAGVSVSITSGTTITNPSDAIVWYITVSGSTITMKNVNNNKYIYQASTTSGKGMGLKDASTNLTLVGYNSSSPIGFKFTLDGASNNIFKYNTGSMWFANYSGDYATNMTPFRLFRLEGEKTDPTILFNVGSTCVGRKLDLNTLFESNSTGDVTYTITEGGSYAEIEGNVLIGTAVGAVTVQATQAAAGDFNAKTVSTTITVGAAVELSSIAITTEPTKKSYVEGDFFDLSGLVVTATYADASTANVTPFCTFTPSLSTALMPSDANIEISYTENAINKTTSQAITVVADVVVLPFSWAGGIKEELAALLGVTGNGLGDNYAAGNAPYRVKFDTNNDYIQIRSNGQPGVLSIGIKVFDAVGASAGTKVTIQGSADGSSFSNVEEFNLNGKGAATYTLTTTERFASDVRYIRILFTKGSGTDARNIGVGPISIAIPEPTDPVVSGSTVTLTTTANMAGWRTYNNNTDNKYTVDANTKVYYVSATGDNKVTLTEIDGGVPANTTVILHNSASTTITLTETDASIAAPGSNLLAVSTEGQNLGKVYRLGYKASDGVGFYTYTTTSAPAGIIYVSSVSSANFLGFDFGDGGTTGISEIEKMREGENETFFDLQGRKVAQPTKGLYIMNGRKVIVR